MRFSAKTFALSALSALLISPSLQAEELEPPNVSIYADVMFSMAQTKRLTYHSDDGKGCIATVKPMATVRVWGCALTI